MFCLFAGPHFSNSTGLSQQQLRALTKSVLAVPAARLEKDVGVPVVNPFYESTGDENRRVEVFLANLEPEAARSGPPRRPKLHAGHFSRGSAGLLRTSLLSGQRAGARLPRVCLAGHDQAAF